MQMFRLLGVEMREGDSSGMRFQLHCECVWQGGRCRCGETQSFGADLRVWGVAGTVRLRGGGGAGARRGLAGSQQASLSPHGEGLAQCPLQLDLWETAPVGILLGFT